MSATVASASSWLPASAWLAARYSPDGMKLGFFWKLLPSGSIACEYFDINHGSVKSPKNLVFFDRDVAIAEVARMKDAGGRPFTTLAYANGGGYSAEIQDLTDVDTEASNYRQAAAVPLPLETHGGEDVAAYARGPNADKLRGVIEQNELYGILRDSLLR